MRISARNQIAGTIVDVQKGATTSHVRIEVGGGTVIMSSITNEAVDQLKLAKGQKAYCGDQGFGRHGRHRLRSPEGILLQSSLTGSMPEMARAIPGPKADRALGASRQSIAASEQAMRRNRRQMAKTASAFCAMSR